MRATGLIACNKCTIKRRSRLTKTRRKSETELRKRRSLSLKLKLGGWFCVFFFFRFILCFWFYLSWLSRGGNFVHRFSVENLQARRAVAFRFKNRIVNRENSKRKNKNKIACHACAAHHRVCANWPMSESIAIGFLQYIITINYDGMQSGLFLIIRSVQRKGTKGELSWCNTARMRIVHIAIVII